MKILNRGILKESNLIPLRKPHTHKCSAMTVFDSLNSILDQCVRISPIKSHDTVRLFNNEFDMSYSVRTKSGINNAQVVTDAINFKQIALVETVCNFNYNSIYFEIKKIRNTQHMLIDIYNKKYKTNYKKPTSSDYAQLIKVGTRKTPLIDIVIIAIFKQLQDISKRVEIDYEC